MKLALVLCICIFTVVIYGSHSYKSMSIERDSDKCQFQVGDLKLDFKSVQAENDSLGYQTPTNSCFYVGVDPNKPDSWVAYSRCKNMQEGWISVNGVLHRFDFDSSSAPSGEYVTTALLDETSAGQPPFASDSGWRIDDGRPIYPNENDFDRRIWNFENGTYIYTTHPVIDTSAEDNRRKKRNVRAKRWEKQINPKYLELAVVVDEGLWSLYNTQYGSEAEANLKIYIDMMLSTAQMLWSLDTMFPQIQFQLKPYTILKTQPAQAPGRMNGDIIQYLQAVCNVVKPKQHGFDHVVIVSGYDMRLDGTLVGGAAYTGAICSDYSCSLVNAGDSAFRAGYTLAHEIGHSLNMKHDGDPSFVETAHCDASCCLMTPYGAGDSKTQWSVCSKTRYHEKLVQMDADGTSCLQNYKFVKRVDDMPGQLMPDEAQCHWALGLCARHAHGLELGDCAHLCCTKDNGATVIALNRDRLDGTYCGEGKICDMGMCISTNATINVVHGGWSQWEDVTSDECGGASCSACQMDGQDGFLRVQVRVCNSPYPNNGGRPCLGHSIRGILCGDPSPYQCRDPSLPDDRAQFESEACAAKFPGSTRSTGAQTECTFRCEDDDQFMGRLFSPNGYPCGGSGGRCVNGQCLHSICEDDSRIYAANPSDCDYDIDIDSVPQCIYSAWTQWSQCTISCGQGSQRRTRSVVTQPAGINCSGYMMQTVFCNSNDCPVDCVYGPWSAFGQCSVTCGTGFHTRVRNVAQGSKNGGTACSSHSLVDIQQCSMNTCSTLDCTFSAWSEWTVCSTTCGVGQQTRFRQPSSNGYCAGDSRQMKSCQREDCDPCGYTQWSGWTACSANCDMKIGTRMRNRSFSATFGGSGSFSVTCSKPVVDTQECYYQGSCGVVCQYTDWSSYSACSVTCGDGVRRRTRMSTVDHATCKIANDLQQINSCSKPKCITECVYSAWTEWSVCSAVCGVGSSHRDRHLVSDNGQCSESLSQSTTCQRSCPVDCRYSEWENFGSCSVDCGSGFQMQKRRIEQHALTGGRLCDEAVVRSITCDRGPCISNCLVSEWQDWGSCDVNCGAGRAHRYRIVRQPAVNSGNACPQLLETTACVGTNCPPVDCEYGAWSDFSTCSVDCGGGYSIRTRRITQEARYGGKMCDEPVVDRVACNEQACITECVYNVWSTWTQCSRSCGGGLQLRNRQVTLKPDNIDCTLPIDQSRDCNSQRCPVDCVLDAWTEWAACSRTCGIGTEMRSRGVSQQAENGGTNCNSIRVDRRACKARECPTDCSYNQWGEWSQCAAACGPSDRTRSRTKTPARNGGLECVGPDTQISACNLGPCPVDCEYSEWSLWGSCSATCDIGVQAKERRIVQQAANGGRACNQDVIQQRSCKIVACPKDCSYSDWLDWAACSATCGPTATRTRKRSILKQALNGGTPCDASTLSLIEDCSQIPCPCADFRITQYRPYSGQKLGSQYKLVEKKSQDCAAKCVAETEFFCRGFYWAGHETDCFLHSTIEQPIVLLNASVYMLYERVCSPDVDPTHNVCEFSLVESNVAESSLSAADNGGASGSNSQCAMKCHLLKEACSGFSRVQAPGGTCYLMTTVDQTALVTDSASTINTYKRICTLMNSPRFTNIHSMFG